MELGEIDDSFYSAFFNQQISGIQTEVFYHFHGRSQSVSREILITQDWKELKLRKQGNVLTSQALLTIPSRPPDVWSF